MESINPATGERFAHYDEHDDVAVDRALARARETFVAWRERPITERTDLVRRVAAELRATLAESARLLTLEMGKPIAAAEAEVEKCAVTCEHFAHHGELYLAPEPIDTDATKSFTRCEPLGVVLAVMPWNFPYWQAMRCAIPALVAGNTVVLKHASNVPGAALALERHFLDAGLPPGAFTTLLVGSSRVTSLVEDPRIAAVSLTGSEGAGMQIAAAAGRVIKRVVLELGGSDPFIVLGDADVDAVADQAAAARCINNGESCIAAKRFIVDAAVAERFESRLVDAMRSRRVGDPLDRATDIGPLAREDLLTTLETQVERSVAQGATLKCGGRRLDRPGFFFPPTVLANVEPGMAAFEEETFGPVAAVTRARDESHAVELANRSRYGLGASVWTSDPNRGERLAARIEAGMVFVNGPVKSDPRLPFGGVKASGYGRELAREGIREFVNLKTVWMAATAP